MALIKVLYIYYPLYFYKDKKNMFRALINFSGEINAMTLAYALKLGLKIYHIGVRI